MSPASCAGRNRVGFYSLLSRLQQVWQHAQNSYKRYGHYSYKKFFCKGFVVHFYTPLLLYF